MANPRESKARNFLAFGSAARESHFRARDDFILPFLSLKRRKLLRKDNGSYDRTNDRSVRYFTLYRCEKAVEAAFLREQRKSLRARKKTEHA